MDPDTAKGWLEIIRDLGVGFTAGMGLLVWLLYKGKLRWDWDVRKCERESDEWKYAALKNTGLFEKSTEVQERTTGAVERTSATLAQLLDRVERIEQRRA